MEQQAPVSVCVPVFNAAKHLEACLDSLLSQTLPGLEIVVTNDGSSDGSMAIIERYSREHPRIRVTSQPNKGLGATRNAGIRASTGHYVAFLDADDVALPNCFERMYQCAQKENADLVVCDYAIWRESPSDTIIPVRNSFTTSKDAYLRAVLTGTAAGFSWNKLYRRQLLIDNNLYFPTRDELENVEDQYYSLRAIHLSTHIAFLSEPLIHYRIHGTSIVNKYQPTLLRDITKLVEANTEFACRAGLPDESKRSLDAAFIKGAVACVLNECKATNPNSLRERIRRLNALASHTHFIRAYDEAKRSRSLPPQHDAILRPLRHGHPVVAYGLALAYALSIKLRT